MKVLSPRLFLLEEGLGYGLVVPFPAYGFATLVSHNENLNSPKQSIVSESEVMGWFDILFGGKQATLTPLVQFLFCLDF